MEQNKILNDKKNHTPEPEMPKPVVPDPDAKALDVPVQTAEEAPAQKPLRKLVRVNKSKAPSQPQQPQAYRGLHEAPPRDREILMQMKRTERKAPSSYCTSLLFFCRICVSIFYFGRVGLHIGVSCTNGRDKSFAV